METITTHWKTITNYDILNGNTSIKTLFASPDFLKEWFTITYNKESLMWFLPLKVFNLLTFSHPSPSGKLKHLTSLLFQHFKPVTTRIERCIKIAVRPSSFYVTTRFITGFQVPVDTYCRKLYITRTLQPNDVERISVAQNDRAITGFPPPFFRSRFGQELLKLEFTNWTDSSTVVSPIHQRVKKPTLAIIITTSIWHWNWNRLNTATKKMSSRSVNGPL